MHKCLQVTGFIPPNKLNLYVDAVTVESVDEIDPNGGFTIKVGYDTTWSGTRTCMHASIHACMRAYMHAYPHTYMHQVGFDIMWSDRFAVHPCKISLYPYGTGVPLSGKLVPSKDWWTPQPALGTYACQEPQTLTVPLPV